jgi:hypothetical protein
MGARAAQEFAKALIRPIGHLPFNPSERDIL